MTEKDQKGMADYDKNEVLDINDDLEEVYSKVENPEREPIPFMLKQPVITIIT